MVQPPPHIERSANPSELLQIEQASRKLRSSARWASVAGFYLPTVLVMVTAGLTFTSYPGGWPEKVLVCLAQFGALVTVFTVPILLSSTGRTVFAYRRLRWDAERAYPITEALGEVTWGTRERALVATVDGERLLSPFFTMFSAVPAHWHHFDLLTPGTYSFSLLPESRLVLRAQPISARSESRSRISEHAPEAELSAPERALRAAFRNGDAEAAANRDGRASPAQRRRLLASHWWALFMAPLIVYLSCQAILASITLPSIGVVVGCVALLGITVFLLVLVFRVVLDALEGRVASAVGTVFLRFGKTDASGWIGASQFTLGNVQARALQQGHPYRVYWFKHSRVVAGVEPADLERA